MRQNGVQPEEARELLRVIRLQLIPLLELLQEIRQSEMFEADDILDAISMKNLKREIELEQRGLLSKTATYTHKHTHARTHTHTDTHARTDRHRHTRTHPGLCFLFAPLLMYMYIGKVNCRHAISNPVYTALQ